LIAKIAIRQGKLCTICWYNFIAKAEHSKLEAFDDEEIEPERIESIEEDFKSGKFLFSAAKTGSLKTIEYFAEKGVFEMLYKDLAKKSIESRSAGLFRYCLGKVDVIPKSEIPSLANYSLLYYQDEILKTVLALPNFHAKELAETLKLYCGALEFFPFLLNAEVLKTLLPFAVNFLDEKTLGADEEAKLKFRELLESFLKKSSGSRQILGSYARFDFVAQALANVPAQD
jgi:hypothetical protein